MPPTHLLERSGQGSRALRVRAGADEPRCVAIEPAPMVLGALEALVGNVGPPQPPCAHARQPRVRSVPRGEEGLGRLLPVGGRSATEAQAGDVTHVGPAATGERKPSCTTPGGYRSPSDAGVAAGQSHPSPRRSASLTRAHRRGVVRGLVRTYPAGLQHRLREVQGHLLGEVRVEAHRPVEPGAVSGRVGKASPSRVAAGVALGIAFAGGSGPPPGEDMVGVITSPSRRGKPRGRRVGMVSCSGREREWQESSTMT